MKSFHVIFTLLFVILLLSANTAEGDLDNWRETLMKMANPCGSIS